MKNLNKKKLIIFDLDGVIFDSRKNMELAINETSKKFKLKIKFSEYFKKIGMPFLNILKSLKIKPSIKIYKYFQKISLREINLIEPYEGVIDLLEFLKKKKIKFSIVTSKDLKRTNFFLKKFKIKPNSVHCPNNKLRGKPYPDHLLHSLKINKISNDNACYVGDTKIDYLAAKKAKIFFIFATYGYGKNSKLYKNKILRFRNIRKFI